MKRTILFFLAGVIIAINIFAQNSTPLLEGKHRARVTNWKKGLILWVTRPNYWESKSSEIIRQIGNNEFEKVKAFSGRNIPCQMQLFCEDVDGKPKKEINAFSRKLDRLVFYKIAEYATHEGEAGMKKNAILRVPYSENKDWDETASWDTVYLIVKNDYVELFP